MWLVIVNHKPTSESAHSTPPPSQFPLTSFFQLHVYLIIILSLLRMFENAYVSFEKVQ